MKNTIAAISTPIGQGGISVIRISGDKCIDIISKIFKSYRNKNLYNLKGYTGCYGYIYDDKGKIDDVILFYFKSPYSYTGEDIVEISCHGGIVITKIILRKILENGAKLADPGEFTKRAFLNNKISLTKAESIIDLINSNNDMSLRLTRKNMEGNIYKKITEIKESFISIVSKIEVFIDYPEEDLEEIDLEEIEKQVYNNKIKLEKLIENYDIVSITKEGIDTVIIGKPNVGKSTIMNLLAGYEKSIVTNIEGTTRDIVEEKVNIGDFILNIYDTAGIRDTKDKIEQIGINKAKEKIETSILKIFVVDNSKNFSKEEIELIETLDRKYTIVLINKIDLERKLDKDLIYNKFSNVIEISAIKNNNINILFKKISEIFKISKIENFSVMATNERQRDCIIKAIKNIDKLLYEIKNKQNLDLISVIIEEIIKYLLELTGENVNKVIIDKIFSDFCVGK